MLPEWWPQTPHAPHSEMSLLRGPAGPKAGWPQDSLALGAHFSVTLALS